MSGVVALGSLLVQVGAADHLISMYSVFGSRTGFSGSADRIALFPVSPNSIGMGGNNARGVIRLVAI